MVGYSVGTAGRRLDSQQMELPADSRVTHMILRDLGRCNRVNKSCRLPPARTEPGYWNVACDERPRLPPDSWFLPALSADRLIALIQKWEARADRHFKEGFPMSTIATPIDDERIARIHDLAGQGLSNAAIAQELSIGVTTVRKYKTGNGNGRASHSADLDEIPSTLRGWLSGEEKTNGPAAPESANGHTPLPDADPDAERSRQGPRRARAGAYKLRAERRRARQRVETASANGFDDLKAVDAFLASRWASLDRLERLRRLLG